MRILLEGLLEKGMIDGSVKLIDESTKIYISYLFQLKRGRM